MDTEENELTSLYFLAFREYYRYFWQNETSFDTQIIQTCLSQYKLSSASYLPMHLLFTDTSSNWLHVALEQLKSIPNSKDLFIEILILAFTVIVTEVEAKHLISSNEEWDDIETDLLQYLNVSFILGHLCSETVNLSIRLKRLQQASVFLNEFLSVCDRLGVISKVDLVAWQRDTRVDPYTARTEKIERAKRDRLLGAQIEASLVSLGYFAAERPEQKCKMDTDEIRELFKTLMQKNACSSISQLLLIEQEIVLLQHQEKELEAPDKSKKASTSTPPLPAKPWMYKLNTTGELKKIYRDLVFKPGHNLPTVTLDEFAREEMEDAMKRSNASMNTKQKTSSDEEEDEIEARNWDDWKDAHPKGYGNTMRNVG